MNDAMAGVPSIPRLLTQLASCAALALLWTRVASAQGAPATSEMEAQSVFGWFDQIATPVAADAPYVLLHVGRYRETARPGFLIDDQPGSVVAVHDVWPARYRVGDTLDSPGGYQRVDFNATVDDLVRGAGVWRTHAYSAPEPMRPRNPTLELLRLARVSWERGRRDQARRLLDLVSGESGAELVGDLVQYLSPRVRHACLWDAVLSCGDRDWPRTELLGRFAMLAEMFPDCEDAPRIREYVTSLAHMIREDVENSVRVVPAQPDAPHVMEAIVYQLREQCSTPNGDRGGDILSDPRGLDSPAGKLLRLGHRAVPTLLSLLDDERLTRCVTFRTSSFFSHEVLRYRDVALSLLNRIARRPLRSREDAERWWATLQGDPDCESTDRGSHRSSPPAPGEAGGGR